MTEQRELDPERFLTTLPRWDQAAFLHQISSGAGALAALKVVPRDPHAPRGDALNTALGTWIAQRWPVVVGALWARRWSPCFARLPHHTSMDVSSDPPMQLIDVTDDKPTEQDAPASARKW